jgi:hypothetical protein
MAWRLLASFQSRRSHFGAKGDLLSMTRGTATLAGILLGMVFLAPALEARQCSGNGDVIGSFGFTASRSGFFLIGATAAGANSPNGGLIIPVAVTPPGTTGTMTGVPVTPPGTTGVSTPFVGSNTGIGNLLSGLANRIVFSAVGRIFADGMGNLYSSPTAGLTTNILVGSYNVTTSCSITMTLTDPFITTAGSTTVAVNPAPGNPVTLQGFVTANGTQLDLSGPNGAVVIFHKTAQAGNCTNATLSGNFTISGDGFFLPSAGNGQIVPGTTPGLISPPPTGSCVQGATGAVVTCPGAFTSGATGMLGTPFSLLGRFVADGAGTLTTDLSGQQSFEPNLTGTFAVNADCTGTARLIDATGIARGISFVLVNEAAQCSIGATPQTSARQELEFVFSDPGVIGGGTAQLQ